MAKPVAYRSGSYDGAKGYIDPSWCRQKQAHEMARMLVYEPDEDTVLAGGLMWYGGMFTG
jgi:hypothetical protein